jgi:hypothetical protein
MYDITKANLCVNCEYFLARTDHVQICKYFLTEDKYSLVTGELLVSRCITCESARNEGTKCGRPGNHFSQIKIVKEAESNPDDVPAKLVANTKEKLGKKDKSVSGDDTMPEIGIIQDPK